MEPQKISPFILLQNFFLWGFFFCIGFHFFIIKTSVGIELFDKYLLLAKLVNSSLGAFSGFMSSQRMYKTIGVITKGIGKIKAGELEGGEQPNEV